MKPIRNKYYNNPESMQTFLRFVSKKDDDYIDVLIPGGSDEEVREKFTDYPGYYAGYEHHPCINNFSKVVCNKEFTNKKYDYFFVVNLESKTGEMYLSIKNKMLGLYFDLNTNKPIIDDRVKKAMKELKIRDIEKYLNMDYIDKPIK